MFQSGDAECIAMISALQPPDGSSIRLGPGGPPRNLAHPPSISDAVDREQTPRGIVLAQEAVRASLRKAKKMQVGRRLVRFAKTI